MSKAQATLVLEHLRKRSITQAEASARYAIFGLSKVISNLRFAGHNIHGQMANVKVGGADRRMTRYTLVKEAK